MDSNEITAAIADGSGLLILNGTITLTCRVRSEPVEIAFRVANVAEDAILCMSFSWTINVTYSLINVH